MKPTSNKKGKQPEPGKILGGPGKEHGNEYRAKMMQKKFKETPKKK